MESKRNSPELSGCRRAASQRWRKGEVNLLKLIIRACGTTTKANNEPPFIILSVLISGLKYWESTAGTLATLEDIEPSEDNVGTEAIRGLIHALQLDQDLKFPEVLRKEFEILQ